MKVLIISDAPNSNSGYGKLTKVWAKHLISKGHEVLVMGGTAPNANIPFTEQEFEGMRLWYVSGYGHQEHVRSFLEKEKPDVVLANADPRFFEYLFKMDNEIRRQCPLVFYHLWDDEPFPDFNMTSYLSCDKIICGSKFTYDLLRTNHDLNMKDFLSYVPIGINTNIYKPISTQEKAEFRKQFNSFSQDKYADAKFIVGVVGRHAERKQLLSIFESFSRWSKDKDDVLLFVHSPGQDQGNALGYAMQMRYKDDKIIYSAAAPQAQPDELINKMYNFFDVLVNRSSAEGFGLPIAEAMSAGTPCISIDNAGPQNLITPDNGWLLESDCKPLFSNIVTPYIQTRYVTDAKFEGILDYVYKNKGDRDAKAAKCREYIIANYNEKKMTEGIETELLSTIKAFVPYPEYTITTWPDIATGLQTPGILNVPDIPSKPGKDKFVGVK